MLPLENWFGLIGSVLLLIPPARDQILRFDRARKARDERKARRAGREVFADLHRMVKGGYEARMAQWNGWDSLSMAAGALCLMLSYVVGA
jgi:hypothetical protein